MRSVSLLLVGATLVGCSTYAPAPRAPDAEAQLQTMLAGKVAGPAVRCIPSHAADNMLVVDDRSSLCRGDISHVVTSSGSTTSTCVFGDFVPYSTPGA
jgi:hypothetical protein